MVDPLDIRILQGVNEQNDARFIFDLIWPSEDGTQLTANLLQALTHNGAYVSAAYIGEEIVAAAFAFPGVDEHGHNHLHSHMTAVKAEYRNRSIGRAIKWHQRDWALEHGYSQITWTFDPLVRRNANLNLVKLGARAFQYFPDFYGDLPDALNAGDPTDRAIARWELKSERVMAAKKNKYPIYFVDDIPIALSISGDEPVIHEVAKGAREVLCFIPADIIEIRASDPARALRWRLALRAQLEPRLATGWRLEGFTPDGSYFLTNAEEEEK